MNNSRIAVLRKTIQKLNHEVFFVSNFHNILYLTGFKTLTTDEREAFVLVTKENVYLFTDERYINKNPKSQIPNLKLIIKLVKPNKGFLTHLEDIAKDEKITEICFEADDLIFDEYQRIKERLVNIVLIPTQQIVIREREIKDNWEIGKIKRACELTDQCLKDVLKTINKDQSEKEIALKIETWIKKNYLELAFDPIVAIDANAAIPHYNTKTGGGKVKNGSAILVDFGLKYKDYISDVTRMVFFGKQNNDVLRAYNILRKAQEKTVDQMFRFTKLSEVDEFCRKLITDTGLPTYPHSTGHGVGLQIHEYPKLSFHSSDNKTDGQVVTVEPGIYIPGRWGMRVEDTVVIKNGKAEALTKFSKELLII